MEGQEHGGLGESEVEWHIVVRDNPDIPPLVVDEKG